jgi:predicted transcriptional regulator
MNEAKIHSSSTVKENFKIVRLAEGDVRCKTDHLANFQGLILANEPMYPEIAKWFSRKVLPGIRQEERVAFIGYLNEKPAVSAIVKKGNNAKFCHLRVHQDLHDANLGEVFFSLMALEIRDLAKNIHFTLPESVWTEKGHFFRSFGFCSAELAETQYRLFGRELACSAAFPVVWNSVLAKIPKLADLYSFGGFSSDNQLLMSVKPEFADRIMRRKKTVELRRKFSTRWIGHRINIYSTAPVMSLVGEARICGVVANKPEAIWGRFHDQVGCSRAEFDAYVSGCAEIYAIELDDIRPYRDRFPLQQIAHLLNEKISPPQSYVTLEKNRPWAKAVSLAAYLHGCFKSTLSFAIDASPLVKDSSKRDLRAPVTRLSQDEFKLA